jgi:hypothetical protein
MQRSPELKDVFHCRDQGGDMTQVVQMTYLLLNFLHLSFLDP